MKLFRLFDIDVKAEIFAVALLALVSLSVTQVVISFADLSPAFALPIGILLGVAFLACVVAHEFGHALVARRYKMQIDEILIHLFGGAALLKSPFPSAKAELWTALAGPMVSLLLAALFFLIGADPIFGFLGHSTQRCIAILGVMNLILGGFNMIPAFPMDGGRVLRATIWEISGNFTRATKIASFFGYLFASWIIGSGLGMLLGWEVPFFGSGRTDGLWNMFFGFFMLTITYGEAKRLPKTIPVPDPEQRIRNQEVE